MRKTIRTYLNRRGYDIIKIPPVRKPFPNLSRTADEYYCETPVGNYYLPIQTEKDGVAATMKRGELFETEIIELAKRYITPGTTALDVGSNFGQMAIEFSKLTGPKGLVYAFEGQELVFRFLEKNIKANNCTNIIAKKGAVYNENGKILIFPEPDTNIPNAFGGNAINPKLKQGNKVETFTIDSLNIDTPISFMKVDIEGSDIFALQGARETILRNKMPIIFEFQEQFQAQFDTSFHDYVAFTESIGYRFERTVLGINFLIVPK